MFALALAALAPLALAAPTLESRQTQDLNCTTYFGFDRGSDFHPGYLIHQGQTKNMNAGTFGLKSNGSNAGTLEPCSGKACDAPDFGYFFFLMCQNEAGAGFQGQPNTDSTKFGHIAFINNTLDDSLCLGSTKTGTNDLNNTELVLQPCNYNYDQAATSGQYWELNIRSTTTASLVTGGQKFNPNPTFLTGAPLTLWAPADGDDEYTSVFNMYAASKPECS